LKYGGFPEVVLSDSPTRKRALLTNYFEDITAKDIVRRFGIRGIEKLEKKKFGYSAFEQIRSVRKVYIIDTGFYYVRGFRFSENIGKLIKASKELKCTDLLVITWDYEEEEEIKGKKISFVPLWKWLLGHDKKLNC